MNGLLEVWKDLLTVVSKPCALKLSMGLESARDFRTFTASSKWTVRCALDDLMASSVH